MHIYAPFLEEVVYTIFAISESPSSHLPMAFSDLHRLALFLLRCLSHHAYNLFEQGTKHSR